MSKLVTLIVAAVLSVSSTSIVFAKNNGSTSNGSNASNVQYGCQGNTNGSHCSEQNQPGGSQNGGSHNSHPRNTSQGSQGTHQSH